MARDTKRSPLESIRAFCIECQGGSFQSVTECTDAACPFSPYRHGVPLPKGHHAPLRACKRYCHESCQADGGRDEVVACRGDEAVLGPCSVFPFRLGRNPNISDATREKARQRELRKLADGSNALSFSPAQRPFQLPKSTETATGGL